VTRGIHWLSLTPGSGYGDASEAYLSGLKEAGVPVTWTPLGWLSKGRPQSFGPMAKTDLDGYTHADIALVLIEHDTVVVAAPPQPRDELGIDTIGRQLVSFTTWETDRLPRPWVEILSRYDRVLVPSRFNRETFVASGLSTPVHVVPHIARAIPNAPVDASVGGVVFYTIATWTARKAVLDTVAAFVGAFGADDDVTLVIHTSQEDLGARARFGAGVRPDSWLTLADALAGRTNVPKIVLSTRWLPRDGIDALHANGDCFISLSRGEGWGLGAFDAGNHGNPVVVTGWGGTLDMLPPGYPYCVDFDLAPTTLDGPDDWWQPEPGERWATGRIEHASTLLRRIYEQRDEARRWALELQQNIRGRFASPTVTTQLLAALTAEPAAVPTGPSDR
jgi:hypothetical protein